MDAHLQHFGLKERPFEIVTDPRFYYASREHREALARLTYLVDQQSMYFGMLTGEIGSGKSLTRKVFSAQIDWERHYVVEFENSGFSFAELMAQMLVKSGHQRKDVEPSVGVARLFELVTGLVTELHRVQRRQLVLLFDEAQDLTAENLTYLKRLSNLNGEIEGHISIVLIGQPELRGQVADLPPLDQRISLRFHLPNLGRDEMESYLRHRLQVAGHATCDLFTPEAAELLYKASRGVPREINRLAKLSLESASASGVSTVDFSQVRSVVEDLRRHQSLPAVFGNRS
ncbi:MAG: ExeA family protein [Terrimicrobiaceae bacterium]